MAKKKEEAVEEGDWKDKYLDTKVGSKLLQDKVVGIYQQYQQRAEQEVGLIIQGAKIALEFSDDWTYALDKGFWVKQRKEDGNRGERRRNKKSNK